MTLDQMQAKIDAAVEYLDLLRRIPQATYEEFRSDFRNVQTALHLLQTAIQALIDLGSYLISRLGLRSPASSLDILDVLHEANRIDEEERDRYRAMFSFRNRVVHLYERIDPKIVHRILTEDQGDLTRLLGRLLEIRQEIATREE